MKKLMIIIWESFSNSSQAAFFVKQVVNLL